MSYVRRPRHEARIADYQVCPPEQVETMRKVTGGLYLASTLASILVTGPIGAVATLAVLPMSALSGSANAASQGASVAGDPSDTKTSDVVLEAAQGLLPLVLLR